MFKGRQYKIYRTLWLASFPLLLLLVVLWEMGGSASGIILRLADILRKQDMNWLAGFTSRLAADGMTQGMVSAMLVLAIYALLQLAGAFADRRLARHAANASAPGRAGGMFLKFLSTITGRPGRFPSVFLSDPASRELHFDYGRHVLLTPLRLGLWAFPVVGFLGTVIGISGAVAHLPQVLEDNAKLNQLLSNLHVAFDTTFTGLTASLAIMAFLFLLDTAWDRNDMETAAASRREKPAETRPEPPRPGAEILPSSEVFSEEQ